MMKNLITIFFLLSIYSNCFSQTKTEALISLGEKIDIHKLYDSKKNYNYLLEEVDFNQKKTIKFIRFCTAGELCSTAYYLTSNKYSEIKINDTEDYKNIQIYFPNNSIETANINIKTEEHFSGETTSSITIYLEKDTAQTEVDSIKNKFIDLLKMYNIGKMKRVD